MRMSGEEHERLKKKDLLRERGWVDKKRREDWLLGDGKEIRRKEAWSMEYADKKKKKHKDIMSTNPLWSYSFLMLA